MTGAAGMTLIGASNLAGHGSTAQLLGFTAVAALVDHLGVYGLGTGGLAYSTVASSWPGLGVGDAPWPKRSTSSEDASTA
ncbi:hypothetical protein ABZ468_53920 [Streptomyces sp. NPDC005708]|uniref:hypothetical protein n=1 Tax=unclassified Streptomyces TaxID=2593676 RepID=UPI0033CB433B